MNRISIAHHIQIIEYVIRGFYLGLNILFAIKITILKNRNMKRLLTEREILFMSELADLIKKYNVVLICGDKCLDMLVCGESVDDDDEMIRFKDDFNEKDMIEMLVTNKNRIKEVKDTEDVLLKMLRKRNEK